MTSVRLLKQIWQLTKIEIDTEFVAGKKVTGIEEGYLIEFIGNEGKVLQSVKGLNASYNPPKGLGI